MKRLNNKPVLRRGIQPIPELQREKKKNQHRNDPKGLLDDEAMRMIYEMCLLKLTDMQIAKVLDVHHTTFAKWKRNNDDFAEVLKMGRSQADGEVVNKLLQRALGYDYYEEHVISGTGANGEPYMLTKKIQKHALPDITAMIFWLKNRQRENWADVHKLEQGGTIQHKVSMEGLSDEEKELVKSISLKQISEGQHN